MSEQAEKKGGRKKMLFIGTVVVVALALLGYGVSTLGSKSVQKKKAPKITLLTPAVPPPPPPPPKVEKKPEPPKEQKEIKINQPVEKKNEQPPSPELKMDGPAGNAPSAFASGNITSEDLSKIGSGSGGIEKTGMFNPFNNYASLLKGELQRYLSKNIALRRRRYSVEIHVWVDSSGALKRYELIGSSKDADTDEEIRTAMSAMSTFSQSPPANMPQPIRLRIITRS